MTLTPRRFQTLLLKWFDQHGRKQLPWQQNKTPYHVWLSEIMLQQTQVSTVIPYYERFLQHFPTLSALAAAPDDQVLHLWAGLGYYSRARNLHRAARMVMEQFAGELPATIPELTSLPGIGPSTAGAIAALAFNQRATILDGNVKRVLARLHAITDPINDKVIEQQLWSLATHYTPTQRIADYTQAMMDLGATCCTQAAPQCHRCPFMRTCAAHQQGIATQIPIKKTAKKRPERAATFIILRDQSFILLHKRPTSGIWGGLWSLPEISGIPTAQTLKDFYQQYALPPKLPHQAVPTLGHTFTHFHLILHPILIDLAEAQQKIVMTDQHIWYNLAQPQAIGLPKPIQTILTNIQKRPFHVAQRALSKA